MAESQNEADSQNDYVRERIEDSEEELLRPITQSWVVGGTVSFNAFLLNAADRQDSNRLSVSRGSVVTAEEAYRIRAQHIKSRCELLEKEFRPPVGVLAVTVDQVERLEVKDEAGDGSRPLTAWNDSMNNFMRDEHGHIDYTEVAADKGKHHFVAKALTALAVANDWKWGGVETT
jgi:hypothetical protein